MITDKDTGWVEASVTINGTPLSFAEAMALRVAVSNFRMFLADKGAQEKLGLGLAESYDRRLAAIEMLMRMGG